MDKFDDEVSCGAGNNSGHSVEPTASSGVSPPTKKATDAQLLERFWRLKSRGVRGERAYAALLELFCDALDAKSPLTATFAYLAALFALTLGDRDQMARQLLLAAAQEVEFADSNNRRALRAALAAIIDDLEDGLVPAPTTKLGREDRRWMRLCVEMRTALTKPTGGKKGVRS